MAARDHVHGYGHNGGGNPYMDVPAVKVILIHAHYSFMEGISACCRYGATEPQSNLG
jgi:hypothetical protein